DKAAPACLKTAAADRPTVRASFTAILPTIETRFAAATDTATPANRATRRGTGKPKPAMITAKAEPPATPIPLPRPSSRTQFERQSSGAVTGPGATGPDAGERQATVGRSANSGGRTIQEQVAAATAVAERATIGTAAARNSAGQLGGGSPKKTDLLGVIWLD